MHAQSVCQAGQAMKEGKKKVLVINRSINEVIFFSSLYLYSELVYLVDRI